MQTCCLTLEVSQSGYHAACKRQQTERQNLYTSYELKIINIFHEHKGRYGRLRIQDELADQGISLSESFIAKTLRKHDLRARKRHSFRPRTTQTSNQNIAPNTLAETTTSAPNQVTVTDITYIRTKEGFLYLSAIMDLHTRVIKGYYTGDTLETTLVLHALEKALSKYPTLKGTLHHTDRGCQYTSHQYQKTLKESQISLSMSAQGYCYDNAHMESFWASLKCEIGDSYTPEFETKAEARQAIFEYIEGYYNTVRKHSSLDYKSPLQAEKQLTLPS